VLISSTPLNVHSLAVNTAGAYFFIGRELNVSILFNKLQVLDYKITDTGDEAITWIDGLYYYGFGIGLEEDSRRDVFVIPVEYIPIFLSLESDYHEFWNKLLDRADLSKEYMIEKELERQRRSDEEEQEEKIAKEKWCEKRNRKCAKLGLHDMVCAYCGENLAHEYSELDHVLPRSRGGTDNPENYVVSCSSCNAKKHKKTPEEANMPILYGDCNLLRKGGTK
jgi:hypothetical protein